MFDVNVRGPFLLCKALGPLLKKGDNPAVVNISSTLAEKAIPGMAAYNASKAAVNQLSRSLALECAPEIRVNADTFFAKGPSDITTPGEDADPLLLRHVVCSPLGPGRAGPRTRR